MFEVAVLSHSWWSNTFGKETATYLKSTKSTQTDAKNSLQKECSNHGHLFITSNQTQGKGRKDNTWVTPSEGSTLLASFLHRLPSPPQPILTPLFGWAVYKSLCETFLNTGVSANFSIKAPNDIYLNDKKVAGLLLDSLSQGKENWIVFGLGLNVFDHPNLDTNVVENRDQNEGLKKSTSLKQEGFEVSEELWTDFLTKLSTHLTVANQLSLETELKPANIKEITKGLKNFKDNQIKSLSPNGDLNLENGVLVPWRSL